MMISTKGRYALRVMIDLAESGLEEYVPLKEIADREEISRKYLENIMTVLSKAGLVDAIHGKGGGYRLNRRPEEYTLAEILNLTEGTLAPVSCMENGQCSCDHAGLPHETDLDGAGQSHSELSGKRNACGVPDTTFELNFPGCHHLAAGLILWVRRAG